MAVSKRTRFEVLRRDNYTCRYCRSTEDELTIDHVTPVALGGTDDPANLVACCKDCNAGKTSTSPDEAMVAQVTEDDIKWAAALKTAAGARSKGLRKRDEFASNFLDYWQGYTYGFRDDFFPLPPDWRQSVAKFYDLQLPARDLFDAVDIAMGNNHVAPPQTFRYTCGIAWKKLQEIQNAARVILAAEDAIDGP